MSKLLRNLSLLIVVATIVSCQSDKDSPLGNIPDIASSAADKITNINERKLKLENPQETIELQKDIIKITQDADIKIHENFLELPSPVRIPFEQGAYDRRYKIDNVVVIEAKYNQITLVANCTVIDTTYYNFVAYCKFADRKGSLLPGWATFMANRDSLLPDNKVQLKAIYRNLENLVDLGMLKTFDNQYFRNNQE